MAIEIKVPTLGESIVEATIGKWLKQAGEPVAAGEALVDLETDKVNVEVTAEQAGVLEQILKEEGQSVGVGEVIGVIGAGAATERSGDGATERPSARSCRISSTAVSLRHAAGEGTCAENRLARR